MLTVIQCCWALSSSYRTPRTSAPRSPTNRGRRTCMDTPTVRLRLQRSLVNLQAEESLQKHGTWKALRTLIFPPIMLQPSPPPSRLNFEASNAIVGSSYAVGGYSTSNPAVAQSIPTGGSSSATASIRSTPAAAETMSVGSSYDPSSSSSSLTALTLCLRLPCGFVLTS